MSKLNLLFSAFFVFAVSGCVGTSTFGNEVSETSSGTPNEGSNDTEQSAAARQNILTSTDLRFKSMCEALQNGDASRLWRGIRSLPKEPVQRYSNIGLDLIVDLFGDGDLDASAIMISYTSQRHEAENIKFFSNDASEMNHPIEGISFLNSQPFTKEIRKVSQGDLNSDGITDLVFFDYGEHDGSLHDGKVLILLSDGTSYRWQQLVTREELRIHSGTLIDFDNDKDLDIVFGSVGAGDGRQIFAYRNDGNGSFSKTRQPRAGTSISNSWVTLNASDIDRDGYHDLISESYDPVSGNFGVQITWGSEQGLFGGIFESTNTSQVTSPAIGANDLLMDTIVVPTSTGAEIYATFAADNYSAGSKIVRYTFSGREQVSSELLVDSLFQTSRWINSVYPCQSGLKFFTYLSPNFNLSSQLR